MVTGQCGMIVYGTSQWQQQLLSHYNKLCCSCWWWSSLMWVSSFSIAAIKVYDELKWLVCGGGGDDEWWCFLPYDTCCYGNTEPFISDLILLVQLLFLMFLQSNLQPALESVWSSKQSKQAGLSGLFCCRKKDARKVDQTSLYFWSKTVFLLSSLLCLCPHNFWVCVCWLCDWFYAHKHVV